MPGTEPESAATPAPADAAETRADAAEILQAITRIGYLITRTRSWLRARVIR